MGWNRFTDPLVLLKHMAGGVGVGLRQHIPVAILIEGVLQGVAVGRELLGCWKLTGDRERARIKD